MKKQTPKSLNRAPGSAIRDVDDEQNRQRSLTGAAQRVGVETKSNPRSLSDAADTKANPASLTNAANKAGSIVAAGTPQQQKDEEERQRQRAERNANQARHMTSHKDREQPPASQAVKTPK
jgi:nitric oxide synthase oxygenase domain/subunit